MRPSHLLISLLIAVPVPVGVRAAETGVALNEPTLEIPTGSSAAFNQADCEESGGTAIVYDFPSGFTAGATKLKIFVTGSSTCPDTPADDDVMLLREVTITAANSSDTLTVKARALMDGCPANFEDAFLVCAVVTTQSYNTSGTLTDNVAFRKSVTVTYDSLQPSAPAFTKATGGDGTVYLEWKAQDDLDEWRIYFVEDGPAPTADGDMCSTTGSNGGGGGAEGEDAAEPGPDAAEPGPDAAEPGLDAAEPGLDAAEPGPDAAEPGPDAAEPGPDAAELGLDGAVSGLDAGTWDASPPFDGVGYQMRTIEDGAAKEGKVQGLTNNQRYRFVLVAVDEAGNVSAGSAPVWGTPLVVHDFYRRYRCMGGTEEGGFGCSTAGAVAVPVAAAALVALLRRRRTA